MIKITRIYAGDDGESHFEDMELPLDEKIKPPDQQTMPLKAIEVTIRESMDVVGGGDNMGWHNAPCRLLYIMLGGTLEIEVSDGTKRMFKAGDLFIAEDTTGRGHLSRARNRRSAIVPLVS